MDFMTVFKVCITGILWPLLRLVLIIAIYFVPAILAFRAKKTNKLAILALNFFLGWTLIGWVISLVWALSKDSSLKIQSI